MAAIRSRAQRRRSRSRPRPCSIISREGGSRVDSSQKGNPGRSSSRIPRSSHFGLAYDTPDNPERRPHDSVEDPTYADAILDRLVHQAHRIELTGESLRKTRAGSESVRAARSGAAE